MAERGNPEVKRTFDLIGGRAEKKTDLHNALRYMGKTCDDVEKGGHPDYHWMVPPMGGYIEAKAARKKSGIFNFQFDQIDAKQRDWMNRWPTISWLWIWYGDVPPDRKLDPARRRVYLIQWPVWLEIEHRLMEAGLSGLPFLKAHALAHRQAGLSAVQMLAAFELAWAGKSAWHIPPTHPFWIYPLMQVSLFAPPCEHLSTSLEAAVC